MSAGSPRLLARRARLAAVGAGARGVLLEVTDGRFTAVTPESPAGDAERLAGVVLPGLANAHSHAFHRALRGRTHGGGGTFWTWREGMYAVAARLDPDSYLALARATFAEMALAGVTCVGEFHYLHHRPGRRRRTTTRTRWARRCARPPRRRASGSPCWTRATSPAGSPPTATPRWTSGSAGSATAPSSAGPSACTRCARRRGCASVRRSTRCGRCRARACGAVVPGRRGPPLHVHLSEQPAENDACLGFYGVTPTGLLDDEGALGPRTTAVHATHLTPARHRQLGRTGTTCCFCPTTERDLADGIGPARALLDAGSPLSLGSDQHAVIDLIEEARALEMHERLVSLQRGRVPADRAARRGHRGTRCLGWADAGRIEVGARADLVAVRLDHPAPPGPTRPRCCCRRRVATSTPSWSTAPSSSPGAGTGWATSARCSQDAIAPLWEDA